MAFLEKGGGGDWYWYIRFSFPCRYRDKGGGGTGLDTYQICIQARFDTYQIPFLI